MAKLTRKPREDEKRAVALKYDKGTDTAPTVKAKGSGWTAERIIEIAKENDVPIQEDKDLVQILSMLEIDQEIPANVYGAVAKILSFIYRMRAQRIS